jgi:hypothetical protein
VGIHAHPVDEVPTLEEHLIAFCLDGHLRDGEPWRAGLYLPHPFSYLMMKLFAFNDQRDDGEQDYGRHHAMDLYCILAYATESDWRQAVQLSFRYSRDPHFMRAREYVTEGFSSANAMGILRLREHAYYSFELQVDLFMSALMELFNVHP